MTITEETVVGRIRRKLKTTEYRLGKARGMNMLLNCGQYYLVNIRLNAIATMHLDLETYARELGVLRADESVAQ
jgi:hypothetical protein